MFYWLYIQGLIVLRSFRRAEHYPYLSIFGKSLEKMTIIKIQVKAKKLLSDCLWNKVKPEENLLISLLEEDEENSSYMQVILYLRSGYIY